MTLLTSVRPGSLVADGPVLFVSNEEFEDLRRWSWDLRKSGVSEADATQRWIANKGYRGNYRRVSTVKYIKT